MTFFHKVRAFTVLATDVATTTISITGLDLGGLAPKAIAVTLFGLADAGGGTAAATMVRKSIGFATSTALRRSVSLYNDHAGANTDVGRQRHTDCVGASNSGTARDGALDVSDMSTPDAVTLIVDDQFPVDHHGIIEVWAGSEVTNATIIDFNKTVSTTGSFNVTSPGFPAVYVRTITAYATDLNLTTGGAISLGRSIPATGINQSFSTNSADNSATSNTRHYVNDVEAMGFVSISSGSPIYRARVTAQHAQGFTWTEDENSDGTARNISALVLGGTFQVAMGFVNTEDNTVDTISIDPGFLSSGMTFLSHASTESAADTVQDDAEFSYGALETSVGLFVAAMGAWLAQDNSAAQNAMYSNASGVGSGTIYANLAVGGTVDALMTALNRTGNIVDFAMTDADATPRFVMWEAFGAAAAAGAGGDATRHSPLSWLRRALVMEG